MQTVRIEFLEKYNQLLKVAEKGFENFPDELCDFITNEFELQTMVLFKVCDDNALIVLGKSSSAKKNFLRGTSFNCSRCTLLSKNEGTHSFSSDAECELLVSEFIVYEACNIFNITETQKGFIKFARKTPFLRAEIDSFKAVTSFIGFLLKIWSASRGGEIIISPQSLSEIVNNISQELRTPANTIIGFASLLNEDNLTSSQSEYALTIKNNAHSLLLLINDIIDISKIDAGKIKENKFPVEVKNFLNEVVKIYHGKINKDDLEVCADIERNIPEKILFDHQKVRFILQSILAHSMRFTHKGKITVRLSMAGNQHINFKVSDNGKGIPADRMKNIFSPFSLFDTDISRSGSATGLDLILAKKYVNLLNGDMNIESTLGKGTIYSFTIKAEIPSEIEKKIIDLPAPGKKNNVLVIEDDYATSKLLSNYLNKWGYEPTIVNTEEQVFTLIDKEHYLAIILDISLPTINGLELLKKIHEHKNTKSTPVIVCSVEADQQKAFMMGAVEYFVKPIQYKFLVEVLQSYRLKKDSNILCVDDDVPTLNLLKQAIESAGFNALAENVSANVMDLIEDKDVDLAIIDLDMPAPNGFELIKLIKSNSKFFKLPIIIYTGKENYQEDLIKIDGLFEELLEKRSTNIEDLSEIISQMINRYDTPPPVEEVIQKENVVKILLAEDYKHSQIIVTRLLKKNNFENIVVVENGEEALENAKKQKFDLILMDMQMPVMNGFEATEKIRLLPGYKDTPVIALTAFAMKGDREKCLEAGATDYIPKPIDSKEFIEKVKYYTSVQKN